MGSTRAGDGDRARRGRRARKADLTSEVLSRLQRALPRPVDGWVPARPGSEIDLDGNLEARTADVDAGVAADLVDDVDLGERVSRATPRGVRLVPAGRAVAGLALLVALALVTALGAFWLARPREEPLPARAELVGSLVRPTPEPSAVHGSSALSSSTTPGASPAAVVVVHVAGAVHRPGVVELAAGSRVADAVEAAGGVTSRAMASSVNLARPVVDGEQVVVLRKGDPAVAAPGGPAVGPPVGSGSAPGGASATAPVDLNTATLEQLDALPGIGPVLAQRILDWRTAHGRFSAVDELGEVSGIGEATLADLLPVVRV